MVIKSILSGFMVKIITGFDDTITQVPIMTSLTKTKKGKFAFLFGIFLAVTLAIILSFLFANFLKAFNYYSILASILIFFLAFAIYFNIFLPKSKQKTQQKIKKIKNTISFKKIIKLISLGFLAAFVTVIDDSLAYSSLFLTLNLNLFAILGIYLALILELFAVLSFSKQISKLKYKKEISVFGLIILGFLILFKII